MSQKILFYSGQQCHLCDLAEALIGQLPDNLAMDVEKVDIRSDHEAYHLYALRIPVLKRVDNAQELGWPFDLEQLVGFLS